MKKLFLFSILFLFLSSLSFAGCAGAGLSWKHITQSWGTNFSPYTQPPGYVLVYAWNGASTQGRIDTKRGTNCWNYPTMILDWGGYGYTDYAWGNFNSCSTLNACPAVSDYTVLVAYNQVNDGTANHQTKWIVDHCNRVGDWNFDDSNSVGQNMYLLAAPSVAFVSKTGSCTGADPCSITMNVTVPTIGGVYGDGSINPRTNTLAGAVVMYRQSSSAPTSGEESLWSLPNDPEGDHYFNFNQLGTSKQITISGITSTNPIYLSYKPILQHATACANKQQCTLAELQALDAAGFDIGYVTANSPPIIPTPVTITSFTARYVDLQNVDLNWETASETDALGFYLYRSTDRQNWVQVNSQIIPAKGQGGAGATYTYNDTVPKQRTYTKYYYKVEEISNNGQRTAQAETETTR